jgi:cytochrome c556
MKDIVNELKELCTYINDLPFDNESIKDELAVIEEVASEHKKLDEISDDYQTNLHQIFTL